MDHELPAMEWPFLDVLDSHLVGGWWRSGDEPREALVGDARSATGWLRLRSGGETADYPVRTRSQPTRRARHGVRSESRWTRPSASFVGTGRPVGRLPGDAATRPDCQVRSARRSAWPSPRGGDSGAGWGVRVPITGLRPCELRLVSHRRCGPNPMILRRAVRTANQANHAKPNG